MYQDLVHSDSPEVNAHVINCPYCSDWIDDQKKRETFNSSSSTFKRQSFGNSHLSVISGESQNSLPVTKRLQTPVTPSTPPPQDTNKQPSGANTNKESNKTRETLIKYQYFASNHGYRETVQRVKEVRGYSDAELASTEKKENGLPPEDSSKKKEDIDKWVASTADNVIDKSTDLDKHMQQALHQLKKSFYLSSVTMSQIINYLQTDDGASRCRDKQQDDIYPMKLSVLSVLRMLSGFPLNLFGTKGDRYVKKTLASQGSKRDLCTHWNE